MHLIPKSTGQERWRTPGKSPTMEPNLPAPGPPPVPHPALPCPLSQGPPAALHEIDYISQKHPGLGARFLKEATAPRDAGSRGPGAAPPLGAALGRGKGGAEGRGAHRAPRGEGSGVLTPPGCPEAVGLQLPAALGSRAFPKDRVREARWLMGDVVRAARQQAALHSPGPGGRPRPRGSRGAAAAATGRLRGGALPLGCLVLVLWLGRRRAGGCLLCDPVVVAGLRALERDYLPSHLNVSAEVLRLFVSRLEETVRQFAPLPGPDYRGMLDEPTLRKASWAFLKELKRIRDSDLRDNLLLKELVWTLHTQKENFAHLVGEFQRQSFCPNKCGLMLQTLIWCLECEKQVHSCHKSYDCGVQNVSVTENEDMILDCELSWHKAAEGLTDYRFYRVWPNGSEVLISHGEESALTKPMVSLEDSGVYRCVLGTVRVESPATVITYRVKVEQESVGIEDSTSRIPLASTIKGSTAPDSGVEDGSMSEAGQCTDQGDVIADSGQNAARILNITLIGLVAGGAVAVLGSLALTLFCARRAGPDLGRAGKQ
ncbi:izumo sperm-egg fusion protein 1 [Macrotis lagotis]|uniref:izumo sperm-egg fusion protein 1 n=1 Tax=Macrotis lagotis TaxID=92651 RepID=UPI003D69F43A